ncbi:MAG: DUF1320 family protein [Flavipsychrobacter sp.]|nr:DUF1320 family protein [Flavipsychrobacter sp.]
MPIITTADLYTHLYTDVLNEIIRNDSTIADKVISAAILETKMYLSRYDLVQLFGTDTTTPAVQDEFLKSLVKDIACWHLVRLSNAGIDYTTARTIYEDAINTLTAIKQGDVQPQGWPYADTKDETTPQGDNVAWSGQLKRENYF